MYKNNQFSHVLTFDLGGGTSDFALSYINDVFSMMFPVTDSCVLGGTSVDDVFIKFMDLVFAYVREEGVEFFNENLKNF